MTLPTSFRFGRAIATGLLTILAPVPAAATTSAEKLACATAYEGGQMLRRQGALRAARERLLTCARDPCVQAIKDDCTRWIGELERAIPSVVLRARDAEGRDLAVRVLVDGSPFRERLDGRAVEIDPGAHTFRFESSAGNPAVEMRVLLGEGEKLREIVAAFTAPDATPRRALEAARPVPWPVYLLGGIGAVGLGGFGFFGASGLQQASALDRCRGTCSQSDVASARRTFAFADISLGVALVALGVGTYLFVTRPASSSMQSASRAPTSE